jgi:hypothetical protein
MKLARSLKEKQVNAFRRFAAGQTASPEGIAEVYQSQAPPTSSQSGQNSRPVSALRPEKSAEIFVFHCDATNAAIALFSAMLKVHPFCLAVFRRDRRASLPNSSYCARNRFSSAIEIRICCVKRLGLIKPRLIKRRIDIGERLRYSAAGFSFNAPRCSGLRFSDMPRD